MNSSDLSVDDDKLNLDGIRVGNDSKKSETGDFNALEIEANMPDDLSVTNYVVTGTSMCGTRYRILKMAGSVIPNVAPIGRTTFFCLSIWCIIPTAIYALLFTQIGYGDVLYYSFTKKIGDYSSVVAEGLIISAFLFYILDIDEWNSAIGNVVRFLCVSLLFFGFSSLVLLVSNQYPYGIITLFALIDPLWLLIVKTLFYRSVDTRTYVSWLSAPLFFTSILTAVAFIIWVFMDSGHAWNSVTRVNAAEKTGCVPDFDEYPDCMSQDGSGETCFYSFDLTLYFPDDCDPACLNVYSECVNGIVLWAGPLMMCVSMLFLSFFCTFLRTEGTSEKDIFNFGKIWIFILCIMWASASFSGTIAVGTSLAALTLASLVASAILLSASFSKEQVKYNKEAILERLHAKYGDNLDYVRGLFIFTTSPFFILYLLLSMINQLVRRTGVNPCSQPCSNPKDPDQTAGIFTVRTRKHLAKIKRWDRANVFTIAVYWGIGYMVLQVLCAQLTIVFLSWIIEKTAEFGLYAVTGIMMVIGLIMFLLPPVPGLPVYFAFGIVLSAQGNESLGWAGSVCYATSASLIVKMCAGAIQQKIIGQSLSQYVAVRQFVSVNSTMMRAMKLVVGTKGITVPKVAILMGGPDWPTYVLPGIMRLPLFPIMIGSIPIAFLILPTCLTGALLYMASLETDTGNPVYPWVGTVATITASITAMVQFGSMIIAAYYLENAADKRKDEVDAIEIDQEVKEADDRDEHMRKCYQTATQWRVIPFWVKSILVLSLGCITASCYMVQFFPTMCFVEHTLTDSVSENLKDNPMNIFLPLGWTSIGLFCTTCFFITAFSSWGKKQAKRLAESTNALPIFDKEQPEDELT